MFRKNKNRKGETIIEGLIAMGVLIIAINIAVSIIGISLKNMYNTKQRLIAINLAREGIEGVRNIRDTNWLKYKHNIRKCWNKNPSSEVCSQDNQIKSGDYIIYKANNKKWLLEKVQNMDESENSPLNTILYQVDIDPLRDSNLDHIYTNDKDIYNHISVTDNALGKDYATKTIFSRKINISYLDNSGNTCEETPNENCNRMLIKSKVSWVNRGKTHSSELQTIITDYLGRERLNG